MGLFVKGKTKRKRLTIIILSVLLFICVCFGIFVLIENKTDKVGDFYVRRKGSSYQIVGLINTEQKEVLIPKRLGTIAVKSVGAFLKDNEHVESVTVESGVENIEENAFSNCKNLKSVNLPCTLKEIGNYILSGSRNITELTAPFEKGQTLRKYFGTMYPHSLKQVSISKGCSEICKGSFEDYRIIEKVIMSNSITKIGENAFSGCSNLVDVQFSNNLIKIEDGAFKETAIQELEELPTALESVGCNAFENCKRLTYVVLPNSLVEVKEYAFKDCGISAIKLSTSLSIIETGVFEGNKELKKIDLSSVKNIKSNAFYNCSSLYEVVLNDDTETVGEQAFFGTVIETISIPKNIKTISKSTFENCVNLQSVELNNVTEIGESAFKNCSLLSNINVSKVEVFGESSLEKCENILSIDVQNAKIIGDYAFSGLKKLTEIKIPLSVTKIGKNIFWKNTELKQIEMPLEENNLIYYTGTVIKKLEKVIIPDGTKKIADNAFYEYPTVKFELTETIEEIGDRAFSGMMFENVTLPAGIVCIGEGAFYNCVNLSLIELPDSITVLSDNLFYNCKKLTNITAEMIKKVGNYAFSNCDKLYKPNFIPLVSSIGDYAFFSCDSFNGEVELSSAVTIGEGAFSDCVNIVGVRLSNAGVKLGTKAFNNCISIGKINNLSSASEIGAYAFNNCVKLNNVELGEELRILKEGSFYGCVSLTRVELPCNLEHISGRVFYNCTNLKDVKIANEQAVIMLESTNAFLNCSANLTISVPEKVLQIYLQDDNWKLFNVIN